MQHPVSQHQVPQHADPQQPIPQPKKSLTQLHWRPILKPPPGKKIWDDLPTIQFDNDELVTLFEKKEKKKKEGVKAPKFLNVLDMKVRKKEKF